MEFTSVQCPECGEYTDQCPCLSCGHQFCPDEDTHKGIRD